MHVAARRVRAPRRRAAVRGRRFGPRLRAPPPRVRARRPTSVRRGRSGSGLAFEGRIARRAASPRASPNAPPERPRGTWAAAGEGLHGSGSGGHAFSGRLGGECDDGCGSMPTQAAIRPATWNPQTLTGQWGGGARCGPARLPKLGRLCRVTAGGRLCRVTAGGRAAVVWRAREGTWCCLTRTGSAASVAAASRVAM